MKRKTKRDCVLVIDLEATCWRGHPPKGMRNEIIEFGIAEVDFITKKVIRKRSIIVKPEVSEISDFCTELTTIDQELIDKEGVSFDEAVDILVKEFHADKRIFFSWGQYDRSQIMKDCEARGVKYFMNREHYNLKPLFSFIHGICEDYGVKQALDYLGIEFEGTPHRGVDDAVNIAKILALTVKGDFSEAKSIDDRKLIQATRNVARLMGKHFPERPEIDVE